MVLRAELIVRALPLAMLALTIGAGLGVRGLFAGWTAKYLGVALWATAAYITVLLVRPSLSVVRAAAIALAVSWAVELAQLTPGPAYLSSKHVLFRLLLGRDFGAWDLPAYRAGVLMGAAVHRVAMHRPTARGGED